MGSQKAMQNNFLHDKIRDFVVDNLKVIFLLIALLGFGFFGYFFWQQRSLSLAYDATKDLELLLDDQKLIFGEKVLDQERLRKLLLRCEEMFLNHSNTNAAVFFLLTKASLFTRINDLKSARDVLLLAEKNASSSILKSLATIKRCSVDLILNPDESSTVSELDQFSLAGTKIEKILASRVLFFFYWKLKNYNNAAIYAERITKAGGERFAQRFDSYGSAVFDKNALVSLE